MQEIISIVRQNPKAGFLYLSPAVPKSSVRYHYYNLKLVSASIFMILYVSLTKKRLI